jgi:hypothetical protein
MLIWPLGICSPSSALDGTLATIFLIVLPVGRARQLNPVLVGSLGLWLIAAVRPKGGEEGDKAAKEFSRQG